MMNEIFIFLFKNQVSDFQPYNYAANLGNRRAPSVALAFTPQQICDAVLPVINAKPINASRPFTCDDVFLSLKRGASVGLYRTVCVDNDVIDPPFSVNTLYTYNPNASLANPMNWAFTWRYNTGSPVPIAPDPSFIMRSMPRNTAPDIKGSFTIIKSGDNAFAFTGGKGLPCFFARGDGGNDGFYSGGQYQNWLSTY